MAKRQLKKIALLTDGIFPFVTGGMQKHSYYLLQYLLKRGIGVILYHCSPEDGSLLDQLQINDPDLLTEVAIPFPEVGTLPNGYVKASMEYARLIAHDLATRPTVDFIYAQGFTAWDLISSKKNGRAIPMIGVNFHGLEMFQYARGVKSKLIQRLFKGPVAFNCEHADIAYSLGGKLTKILTDITSKENVREIPIGLERTWLRFEDSVQQKGERLQVAFIGRYERRKGVEELSTVMKRMVDLPIDFHLIGPIPADKQIKQANVTYHGLIKSENAIKEILDICDLLTVPSMAEGMPTVILEAMARGLAVIASDVGAVCTEVTEANGWLMKAGSVEDLYAYLHAAMSMPTPQFHALKMASIKTVEENFLWDRIIDLTIEQIENDLNQKR